MRAVMALSDQAMTELPNCTATAPPDRGDAPAYYDRDAEAFAARYDAVQFAAVHPLLARYLPESGRVLDVGAGSGRDARAMAARGLDVTAAEPSAGLRAIASAKSPGIRWIDDRLPGLANLREDEGQFDFILCSAVLMLIAPEELAPSFAAMARLLTPSGRLGLNLRVPAAGEPGNLFFAHSDEAVLAAARASGLVAIDRGVAGDAIGRVAYRWRSFVFARECE
jgi:SAM-dependent methyltransferase